MFITEEELEERLKSPRNLANRFRNGVQANENETSENKIVENQPEIQFREIKRPGNNRPWLSSSVRTRIAAEHAESAITKKTETEIAKTYDVEVSTVSDIVNNVRRVPDSSRSVNIAQVDAALDRVRGIAIDKLTNGLNQLTEDKISGHSAKDISTICANMARVVQHTLPQEKGGGQQINLVVYAPEMKNEKTYDVVEI